MGGELLFFIGLKLGGGGEPSALAAPSLMHRIFEIILL